MSSASEVHPLKASSPIVVSAVGRVREVREVKPAKAPSEMVVRAAGRATEVREEQPRNALLWIVVVRAAGRLRSVREEHSRNAPWPTVVRPEGRVSLVLSKAGLTHVSSRAVWWSASLAGVRAL